MTDAQQQALRSRQNSLFSSKDFVNLFLSLNFNSERPVEEIVSQLKPLMSHLQKYWNISRNLFDSGDIQLAVFFAITLIEECAKVGILFWAGGSLESNDREKTKRTKETFYRHNEKYLYSAIFHLAMNKRVDNLYKPETKLQFEDLCNTGALFKIRNQALYFDVKNKQTVTIPESVISKQQAGLLLCMSGEVYASTQEFFGDYGSDEEQRIYAEIDSFKKRHNLVM